MHIVLVIITMFLNFSLQVPVDNNITYDAFRDLLTELFLREGLTQERILVLFVFCSDLAIRLLRDSAIDFFERCISWSTRYIKEKICGWVQEHGGWVSPN